MLFPLDYAAIDKFFFIMPQIALIFTDKKLSVNKICVNSCNLRHFLVNYNGLIFINGTQCDKH